MATTVTVSNEFKYEKGKEGVDFSSDTFKLVLLESGFTFDPDTHGTYSDISGDEITSAGGYTVGGETLSVDSAWAQNNTDDEAAIEWADKALTASGADFDTFCAAAIIDDSHASKVVVGCLELGQDIDVPDGQSFLFQNLKFKST